MSDESVGEMQTVPPSKERSALVSSKERSALVAKALSDAARRARFSTKRRRSLASSGLRERRGERIARLVRIVSFVAIVVLPVIVSGVYIFFFQSPQYSSEARFTLRGGLPAGTAKMGSLSGAPAAMIIQDTQIVINYLASRAIVEALDKSIDMQQLYEKPDVDRFSRLKPHRSIEKVLKYWKKHTSVSIQLPAGIVVFTVRAFTPDDAVKIIDAALESAEKLVNRMNDQMRNDMVALAEAERKHAQAAVVVARTNLEKARNSEGMLNAEATSTGLSALMESVRIEILKFQQDYDSQRHYVNADAPQMKNLRFKIEAAKSELAKLQAEMTENDPQSPSSGSTKVSDDVDGGASRVLSGAMSRLDALSLDNLLADKIYGASLAALEQARVASETKLMYINTFVAPVPAEDAKYPKRGLDFALVLVECVALWGAVVGVLILVKGSFT